MFDIINHKLFKMKRLITLLIVVFVSAPVFAQNKERLSVHYMDIQPNQYKEF